MNINKAAAEINTIIERHLMTLPKEERLARQKAALKYAARRRRRKHVSTN